MKSPITTHVLDTARGRPAAGLKIALELRTASEGWKELGRGETDADGRAAGLFPAGSKLAAGTYRLVFQTGEYHRASGTPGFYPEAAVVFEVKDPGQHHHVPLLLSPFGYSTYRGS